MRKVVVIVGPTATGKTSLAMKLCQKLDGEVVSVDSRQAYLEMEIGTGKKAQNIKTRTQSREIPIYLYNVASPNKRLNAFEFSKLAWEKIEDIWARGKIPF